MNEADPSKSDSAVIVAELKAHFVAQTGQESFHIVPAIDNVSVLGFPRASGDTAADVHWYVLIRAA